LTVNIDMASDKILIGDQQIRDAFLARNKLLLQPPIRTPVSLSSVSLYESGLGRLILDGVKLA
jgi:hypothetical protein